MREALIRSVSGIVYILLLSAAIFWSDFTLYLLFGLFLLLAVGEFCSLTSIKKAIPLIVAAIAFVALSYEPGGEILDLILLAIAMIASLAAMNFLVKDSAVLSPPLKIILLIGYVIVPFLLMVKIPFWRGIYEPEVLFAMFILVWVNDTFAFIVGKTFGKHKLLPKVSPKKTWEGFLGGVVFCMIAACCLAGWYLEESLSTWLLIGLIMSVIGTIGDLVESKLKRIAGVKDSGKIMPGHGGILDRLDSVIFAAPFVFLLFQILRYVS